MYIVTIPNRSSPSAILLRESYRQDGKVTTRTLANRAITSFTPTATFNSLLNVLVLKGVVTTRSWLT